MKTLEVRTKAQLINAFILSKDCIDDLEIILVRKDKGRSIFNLIPSSPNHRNSYNNRIFCKLVDASIKAIRRISEKDLLNDFPKKKKIKKEGFF